MKLGIIASAAAIGVFATASTLGSPRLPIEDPSVPLPAITRTSQAELRQEMRKLWTEHVVWTRSYIIASTGGEPDAVESLKRLMRNQEEIGDLFGDYYGRAIGDKMTVLLKEHIATAGEVIKAAKAGNKPELQAADKRWRQNAEEIADFLSNTNPEWKRGRIVDAMNAHLAQTTDEVTARLNKDWAADVKAYDKVYSHILRISDALANGIATQFRTRVTADR